MENENLTVSEPKQEDSVSNECQVKFVEIRPGIKFTPQFDKIACAMAKAQCEIGSLQRNKSGYNYTYADLAAVLECIKEPMAKNGLNIMQFPEYNENSQRCPVTTIITHESGQMMISTLVVPVVATKGGNDVQAYGSAITYARRYAIMSVMDMAAEDDDGAKSKDVYKFSGKAQETPARQNTSSPTPANAKPATVQKPVAQAQPIAPKPGIQQAQAIATKPVQPQPNALRCSQCNETINDNVAKWSAEHYGRHLCMKCQSAQSKAS